MFSYRNSLNFDSKENIALWTTMAFMAGTMNTGGFLACHRFVSHVTGFSTQFGVDLAQGAYDHALAIGAVPLFFFVGAGLSGYLVDVRMQKGLKPLYPLIMLAVSLLNFAVVWGGYKSYFGSFGSEITLHYYYLLAALCLACGLINGTVTTAYGAIIRTTHLTGITTDLSIGIVRILSRTHIKQPRRNELKATWMRIGLILSFTLGSALSAYVYLRFQYWGFLIPAFIGILLFLWSLRRFKGQYHGTGQ